MVFLLGFTVFDRTAHRLGNAMPAGASGTEVQSSEEAGKTDQSSEKSGTDAQSSEESGKDAEDKKDYIKWVEFNVTSEAMNHACSYDVDTYGQDIHLDWIELLAYLGTKYGGDFKQYKSRDMDTLAEKLISGETTMDEVTKDMKYYSYYKEAYTAVLGGMLGEYDVEVTADVGPNEAQSEAGAGSEGDPAATDMSGNDEVSGSTWKTVYGLKAYSPIAKTFPYSDYDDFGVSRSYGYRRNHLGHDMMGQVGTPIIAVESGYVTALGWNQYGGWRIGVNSFDGKRYYYYAHLRQNRPYAEGLEVGSIVQAGDVIGYMGRTGYSTTENVNNIDTYHLHFGLQLIFDESQREGNNEIWVSGYELVKFLYKHQSEVVRNDATKEWTRAVHIKDPAVEVYKSTLDGG